jgi:hypothetical protein
MVAEILVKTTGRNWYEITCQVPECKFRKAGTMPEEKAITLAEEHGRFKHVRISREG